RSGRGVDELMPRGGGGPGWVARPRPAGRVVERGGLTADVAVNPPRMPRRGARLPPALDDLDPVAVRVPHEADPRAALADGVGRLLRLDPLLLELVERSVEVGRGDRDVVVAGAELVRVDAEVVGQLEAVLVSGQPHEDVDGLVADRHAAALLESEGGVEGDRAVDVADAVAGVDERGHRPDHASSVSPMVVERSMNSDYLSNTCLVGQAGGEGFFVDAGGPVAPLLAAAERNDITPTHVLLTHHHGDHVQE